MFYINIFLAQNFIFGNTFTIGLTLENMLTEELKTTYNFFVLYGLIKVYRYMYMLCKINNMFTV